MNYIPSLPGVYVFENIVNGHQYIGSSVNMHTRNTDHLCTLRRGCHNNGYLQRAYDKYGQDAFRFRVLLICDKHNLRYYERVAIFALKPAYNIIEVNESFAWYQTEETLRKKVIKTKGRKLPPKSQETRQKIRESLTGRKNGPLSDEHKKKLSASKKGRVFSEEHCRKLSEAHKRRWEGHVPKPRRYIPKPRKKREGPSPLLGIKRSSETCKKIGDAHRGKRFSVELREKLSRVHSVLSDDAIREIRRLAKDGVSQRIIGEKFGRADSTISRILNGRLYEWVE